MPGVKVVATKGDLLQVGTIFGKMWAGVGDFVAVDQAGIVTPMSADDIAKFYEVQQLYPSQEQALTKEHKFEIFRQDLSELIWKYTGGQDSNFERTSAVGCIQFELHQLVNRGFCYGDPEMLY